MYYMKNKKNPELEKAARTHRASGTPEAPSSAPMHPCGCSDKYKKSSYSPVLNTQFLAGTPGLGAYGTFVTWALVTEHITCRHTGVGLWHYRLHFSQKIVPSLQIFSVTSQPSPVVSTTHSHPHDDLCPLRLGAKASPPSLQLLLFSCLVTEMRKINNTMACGGTESRTSSAGS